MIVGFLPKDLLLEITPRDVKIGGFLDWYLFYRAKQDKKGLESLMYENKSKLFFVFLLTLSAAMCRQIQQVV